ncbi:hypothetical protein, partial [Klebsiella pneumoniae]|uniref:hypothetical protein n=1 Tax=Klebsiella pneumoniae TaxID=573 RepID=UPI001CB70A37
WTIFYVRVKIAICGGPIHLLALSTVRGHTVVDQTYRGPRGCTDPKKLDRLTEASEKESI